jgi:tRNA A-37 threonylcarbamoyl transferase component Bud32
MSGIVHAGKMQAIDSNKIGTHGVNLENVDESLTGLNVDFAQSCVLEDPRGQINLTFSQPVEVTVDDSLGTLTNEYDNAGNRSTGEESEQRDTIREMPQFSRSSSDGMSYATALSNLEDVSAAKKESSLSNRGSGQVIKVAIGPQHFDLLKLIGEGAFGKVIMVKNLLDQKIYAMKVISKKLLRKKNSISYMKSERDILTKVNHPFVVSLFFAFQTEKKIFLVMDFLGGGELFFHLKRRGLILEKEVRFYLAEMVLAIEFLHNKGVIHRDLKPENVLLRVDGHVCITDFGLGKKTAQCSATPTCYCYSPTWQCSAPVPPLLYYL